MGTNRSYMLHHDKGNTVKGSTQLFMIKRGNKNDRKKTPITIRRVIQTQTLQDHKVNPKCSYRVCTNVQTIICLIP